MNLKTLSRIFIVALVGSFTLVNITSAFYKSDVTITENKIEFGCIVEPEQPQLKSPKNKLSTNKSKWKEKPDFEWKTVNSPCEGREEVFYYYESYQDKDMKKIMHKSGKLNKNNVKITDFSNKDVWWRVKSCTKSGKCSKWTELWELSIEEEPQKNESQKNELQNNNSPEVTEEDTTLNEVENTENNTNSEETENLLQEQSS